MSINLAFQLAPVSPNDRVGTRLKKNSPPGTDRQTVENPVGFEILVARHLAIDVVVQSVHAPHSVLLAARVRAALFLDALQYIDTRDKILQLFSLQFVRLN